MERRKCAKILLFLILLTLISGRVFAQQNRKIRVCISNINTKNELSTLVGDVDKTLEFEGAHFFYNASGVIFEVGKSASYIVKSSDENASYYMDVNGTTSVKPKGFRGVLLYEAQKPLFAITEDVKIASSDGHFIYDSRKYAQDIYFIPAREGFVPVNYVDVEEYLRGVVPVEMPHTWHIEALKAQSVAARTYAYRSIENNADKFVDILSTTADQAYSGMSAYKLESDYAISNTSKAILSHENKPILAFYSADNGGYTVGSSHHPYLKPKLDLYSGGSKSAKWDYYVRFEELERVLGVPKIKSIEIQELDKSLRVSDLLIDTVSGSRKIKGSELRKAIGYSNVKSTFFTISNDERSSKDVLGGYEKERADLQKTHPASLKPSVSHRENNYYIEGMGGIQKLDANSHYVESASGKLKLSDFDSIYVQNISKLSRLADVGENSELISSVKKEYEASVDPAKFLQSRGDTKVFNQEGGIYIKGLGYGHGMGMSQWGAKNRAESGQTYQEILEFYYEGAVLENK